MKVTEEQITEALREHSHEENGGWWIGLAEYSESDARAIAEACLLLGVPVTAVITPTSWLAVVRRIVALEEQLSDDALLARLVRLDQQGRAKTLRL